MRLQLFWVKYIFKKVSLFWIFGATKMPYTIYYMAIGQFQIIPPTRKISMAIKATNFDTNLLIKGCNGGAKV